MSTAAPHIQPTGRDQLEAMLAEQRALTQLGLHDLEARWRQQPDLRTITVGEGTPGLDTLRGNPEDPFYGVAVYNPTGKNVIVGFNAGAAVGSVMQVPPGTVLVWPVKYENLSIAFDNTGPQELVGILRLRYPPAQPALTAIAPQKASAAARQPADVIVAEASGLLAPANSARKGLEIVNRGATAVRLSLAEAAVQKRGLWLSSGGGSWNGIMSNALWLGPVSAICDLGETTVAVVEV